MENALSDVSIFGPNHHISGFGKSHSIWRAAHHFDYCILLFPLSPLYILVCILCCEYKMLDFWIPLSHITCFNTKRPHHELRYWLMLQRSGVSLPPELNSQASMTVSLVCTLYWGTTSCNHLQCYLSGIPEIVLEGSFLLKTKQAKDGN